MSHDAVTVCDRCGAPACLQHAVCVVDGLARGTAEVPEVKVMRNSATPLPLRRSRTARP